MRDGNSKKSKLSWPKTLVKKWFNIKSKAEDFDADDAVYGGGDEEWRNTYSERETCTIKKSKTERLSKRHSDRVRRGKIDMDASQVTDVNNYRFQEIVPLNAGNVLGTEDNGPAKKWLALIRKTLNNLPGTSGGCHTPSPIPDPIVELDADFEGSTKQKASSFFHRRSFQSLSRSMRMDNDMSMPQPRLDRRFSVCDRVMFGHRPSDCDPNYRWGSSDDENGPGDSPVVTQYSPMSNSGSFSLEDRDRQPGNSRYCLVASKQMVGIFLTVWVKSDLRDDVRNMKVSCVGRGIWAILEISHLTSGQKEGDELRRNSDVMEILRKTRFPRVHGMGDENSPQTILEHDRIIWLGDLNYRIALSYRSAKALVEMRNWRALLENDQLRIEQRRGRVFEGWSEGKIYFPPTYKYLNNSDRYAGDDRHTKEKRRTPAWCDRILWHGRGIYQLSYVRGESRFSDHRPVYSVFLAEVESINRNRIKKSMSCSSSRIEYAQLRTTEAEFNALFHYIRNSYRFKNAIGEIQVFPGIPTLFDLLDQSGTEQRKFCPDGDKDSLLPTIQKKDELS
ncbi:type I inositol polyphosphate 5-phosphatase 4 [Prunus yedoensis var. nudiflora]|uniref:Type I inositol polyphosphate 5-phosphatase 4 n=1 Tax=Prunus yedoensis var. nudiflora TaxID=2094558 RepID=A0A314XPE9_PRUYE|nr:type I inositol polyphosphate 5-phosphatase 4 [Prunus yedoensis var. nudiflora]